MAFGGRLSYAQRYNQQVDLLYDRAASQGVSQADAYQALKTQTNNFSSIPNVDHVITSSAKVGATADLTQINLPSPPQAAPAAPEPLPPAPPPPQIQEMQIPTREVAFIEAVKRRAGNSEALMSALPPSRPGGLLEPATLQGTGGLKRRSLTRLDDEEEEEDLITL